MYSIIIILENVILFYKCVTCHFTLCSFVDTALCGILCICTIIVYVLLECFSLSKLCTVAQEVTAKSSCHGKINFEVRVFVVEMGIGPSLQAFEEVFPTLPYDSFTPSGECYLRYVKIPHLA